MQEDIGKALKAQRESFGLRQVEVAKEGKLNISRLSLIENGWIQPRQNEVERIQASLDHLIKHRSE